ncbi:MAG TPA: CapA family protein [Acidimicrobiales bacterium]
MGDTMLGRGVAERLRMAGPRSLFSDEVVAAVHEADFALANLECCISERGTPAAKMFVFRAPPVATEALRHLGVHAVTLANNHAVDFGTDALLDTITYLDEAGIAHVGAGPDIESARRPLVCRVADVEVGIVGLSDHPAAFAAGSLRPGIAYASLERDDVPSWVTDAVRDLRTDVRLVTPHWGPNMVQTPLPYVQRAASALLDAGATLIAGHSAHVFHGVAPSVIYDLGDFVDDYATDPLLRNDLGLLWLVDFARSADGIHPVRVEAVPIELEFCFTRFATGEPAAWITRRFVDACRELGTEARREDGRLVVDWPA